MFLLIEFVIAALIVPLALFAPPFSNRLIEPIERKLSRFATHRKRAVLGVLLLALGARLAVLPAEPVPEPKGIDEFSYLLMADTFTHGRLTNPTHLMWKHFETFSVNQLPTYCSVYYPAQGFFLAFGQQVLGHAFWGVWLSTGLMCAAFCWALQGWVPPAWAFFGGILAIIRLGTFSYWANSYWGGSVAALGGALVLGSLPRIQRYRRVGDTVAMAVGLAILGNSRPYESIFYALPVLLALGWQLLRSDYSARNEYWRRVLIPGAAIIILTLALMSYYFKRCTGSASTLPYVVYVHTYGTAPEFPWQRLNTGIHYRHPSMAYAQLSWPVQQYERARHDIVGHLLLWILKGGIFFAGPILLLPWFVLGVILPYGLAVSDLGHKAALLIKICLFTAVGLSLPVFFEDHYAAPACCAFYALEIQAMRRVYIFDRLGKLKGKSLVRYMFLACLILFGIRGFSKALHIPSPPEWYRDWESSEGQPSWRSVVESKLLHEPGQHLVIVDYTGNEDAHSEWVFNKADIDDSKIVWARNMGPQDNAELVQYFTNRKVWLLESGEQPPQLWPYGNKERNLTHAFAHPMPRTDQSTAKATGTGVTETRPASSGK